MPCVAFLTLVVVLALTDAGRSAEPLHQRIDALMEASLNGKPVSAIASDLEFLRRVTLDLNGRVPTVSEIRAFASDSSSRKRADAIDQLLRSSEYPLRMAELFHVMLMERLGDHPDWMAYLKTGFQQNRPWDVMAREMLRADPSAPPDSRGASFFIAKRLENYGQNPVDYPGLARDIGRLFLGKDMRCAECHDHLTIDDYKQADFQGLFAFIRSTSLIDAKTLLVAEKPNSDRVEFRSVFNKVLRETGPRLPGMSEISVPSFKKGEEYRVPPDPKKRTPGIPKFSVLAALAEQLAAAENHQFARTMVNRLWFVMMGRGLVHPLDLDHAANPPSHPAVLELLTREFIALKFDMRAMLRELAMTRTYQRSSRRTAALANAPTSSDQAAIEKRLTAEQLLASTMVATGNATATPPLRAKFLKAFANPMREPEVEPTPALKVALFLLNDATVLELFAASPGNLIHRTGTMPDAAAVEEIYLSVLSRFPDTGERSEGVAYLAKNSHRRSAALGNLAWSLWASTEFMVNH